MGRLRAYRRPLLICGCHHPKSAHKRGWGPCTFSTDITVIGNDGMPWAVVERCDCRRFDAVVEEVAK